MPSISSRPWTQPSSPQRPCSALKQTSGVKLGELLRQVAADVDAGDAIAFAFERGGAGLAGRAG